MKIYDISRGFFSTPTYPGDPIVEKQVVQSIANGSDYHLTSYSTGCHTATHVDAPAHFIQDGITIEQLPMNHFFGKCTVVTVNGIISKEDIENIVKNSHKRIIFKGDGKAFLSKDGAKKLVEHNIILVGTDAQSIGNVGEEALPHRELLGNNIPIVEGLELSSVDDGEYIISAFPIKMEGLEASPTRAVLIKE